MGAQNFGTVAVAPPNGAPAIVKTSAPYESGPCPAGFGALFVSVQSTKAGNLNVQRYADVAMTVPVGDLLTAAISANTQATVSSVDGIPFLYFNIEITNTGSGDATISKFAALTGPLP